MDTTYRVGFIASVGLALVGLAYIVVVTIGIVQAGLDEPIVDPTLGVMEALTLLSAPFVVIWLAAIQQASAPDQRVYGLVALAFGTIMAGLTSGVHFVALTAGRQTGFSALEWPSTLYAVELLAWDVFLGLALLFAAPVFTGRGRAATARWVLAITGVLCLAGAAGPLIGDMAVQRIGIVGYGLGLPVACVLVARWFRGRGMAVKR